MSGYPDNFSQAAFDRHVGGPSALGAWRGSFQDEVADATRSLNAAITTIRGLSFSTDFGAGTIICLEEMITELNVKSERAEEEMRCG